MFDRIATSARTWGNLLARRAGTARLKRRRLGLAAGLLLFVGGVVVSLSRLPDVHREPRWELLALVALVGVPLTLAFNAAEYQVAAAVVGHRVPFISALRVGTLAAAANLLPIPGAVLVRANAIRRLGASYRRIALSAGVTTVAFIGAPCLVASLLLAASGEIAFTVILAAAGVLLLGLALGVLTVERGFREGGRILLAAEARAVGALLVKAGRLYLVLLAFHYDAGARQALTLAIGAVIGTALGFFPAGLGAAEALAAALSPLVGISAAVGFVANAIDRVISMIGLAIACSVIFLVERRRLSGLPRRSTPRKDEEPRAN
jgi:uncharacterized membrane protein YbhN (UPF0104 family)